MLYLKSLESWLVYKCKMKTFIWPEWYWKHISLHQGLSQNKITKEFRIIWKTWNFRRVKYLKGFPVKFTLKACNICISSPGSKSLLSSFFKKSFGDSGPDATYNKIKRYDGETTKYWTHGLKYFEIIGTRNYNKILSRKNR